MSDPNPPATPPADRSPDPTTPPRDDASPDSTASGAASPAEDSPADASSSTDETAAEDSPTVEDTVAANVDAPAQTPGGGATPPSPPADEKADGDAPATEDTVAANVDAPAQAAGGATPSSRPGGGKADEDSPTEAIPGADAIDATREMPADADKDGASADGEKGSGGGDGDKEGAGVAEGGGGGETPGVVRKRRNPWPTVGTLAAVLVILAGIGYFGGLGPLNRLSTTRDLNPPDQVSGLNRITDQTTRERLQLDQTRDALRRINDGKKASVEAYGEPVGDKLFMVIALRGKVDIDKEIRDSGATGDQVKKAGKSTCATSVQDIPTSCYRGSNTLTVIAQGLTDKADVNAVAAVADEAFDAMK